MALQPAVPLEVEVLPEIHLTQHDRVDHAHDRAGPPAPLERVVDRLVGSLGDGGAEAGQAVGALDLGDPGAVTDVVAQPFFVSGSGKDGRFAAAQPVPEELATPSVAGDGSEAADRDPSSRCAHVNSPSLPARDTVTLGARSRAGKEGLHGG